MSVTSFRMIDNRVRNFHLHLHRLRSYAPLGVDEELDLRQRLRRPGRYHVKITTEAGGLLIDHRPDRPITDTVRLRAHPIRDERTHPTIKGPDLYWLGRQLAATTARGVDEGLLADERGRIIEAIYASIVCLDVDEGHVLTSTHPRALPSTTVPSVVDYLCTTHGFTHRPQEAGFTVEQLRRHEVWLANAFSGVRQVTDWVEYSTPHRAPRHFNVAIINDYLWAQADTI